ncbi:Glutathione transport system permease protein GsiC [Anaerohalosphaera lusitana]|uniref:Glutathione transport system permease protein GsiC n=1 Tax=Anaerohalosphaera lusitana TaxID=1936003 RepID=A0A1U9NNG9_9BACT|nr:ABC transporter permease [Anaerohalosphaera lusitana]AQT69375.1 Glutathione transport system permease protein GsiC [Anaerohalosphaera lusitana]
MIAYVIRRLLYCIPIVFGVLVVTFLLFNVIRGDVSMEYAGKNATPETIEEIREELGLNKPVILAWDSQFTHHLKQTLTFSARARDRELVIDKIKRGVPYSLAISVPVFFLLVTIGVSLALIVAFIRGTIGDFAIVIACIIGMSIPYLSYILFGQYFLAYKGNFGFPVFYQPYMSLAQSVILPIIIGVAARLGFQLRFYRTVMLDEMRADYVRTAFSKGLGTKTVLFKHVLKNALIPVITNVVLTIPYLILGSFLLERFFGIPGLGYLMLDAIGSRDFEVINALTFMVAILYVVFNVLTDVCYALVDPRVKLE